MIIKSQGHDVLFVSVPLQRVAKFLLTQRNIESLKKIGKVKLIFPDIVSRSYTDWIAEEYGVEAIVLAKPVRLRRIKQFFTRCDELVRIWGFIFQHRSTAQKKYERFVQKLSARLGLPPFYVELLIAPILGLFAKPLVWKTWRWIYIRVFCRSGQLDDLLKEAGAAVSICTSNWCQVDQFLAAASERSGRPCNLLTYSTDQVLDCGRLFIEFEQVWCQGELEKKRLISIHGYESGKIKIVGSLWWRALARSAANIEPYIRRSNNLRVLVVGSSSRYFLKNYEIDLLRFLSSIKSIGPEVQVKYRPLIIFPEDDEAVEVVKDELPQIEIAQSAKENFALHDFMPIDGERIIDRQVKSIIGTDLIICALGSSLVIDAACMGVNSVFYWGQQYDEQHGHSWEGSLDEYGCFPNATGVPILRHNSEILKYICDHQKIDRLSETTKKLKEYWDGGKGDPISIILGCCVEQFDEQRIKDEKII